ncbi:hypothetical protein [Actinomadura rifamycini]|uniref:hypothetical protein n=1 Tax=Actinomadura rifamycini TaxID=31962 RepID=UPI00041C198F|nr:hypothetical protein [Actinomadura rifamycini]
MVVAILVCGVLVYALFDLVRTGVRRRRAAAAHAAAAAAWAEELETLGPMLWTEADQEWLESRRISLPR